MKQGKLFVIEGLDASGKETQSKLIEKRLSENGYDVKLVSFPNYDSPACSLVKMYLNGDFGENPDDVDPKISSVFYAMDRYAAFKTKLETLYNNGKIIICDRFTTSNMLHQACKNDDIKEKEEFLNWLLDFEYNLLKIPSPNKVFFLNVPPKISKKLMEKRKNKFTNDTQKDIHEKNDKYMNRVYENAMYLIKNYGWEDIDCVKNESELKSIEEINDILYKKIISCLNSNY